MRRNHRLLKVLDLDVDEIRGLVNDLWTIHDDYAEGEDRPASASADSLGEDEEV